MSSPLPDINMSAYEYQEKVRLIRIKTITNLIKGVNLDTLSKEDKLLMLTNIYKITGIDLEDLFNE